VKSRERLCDDRQNFAFGSGVFFGSFVIVPGFGAFPLSPAEATVGAPPVIGSALGKPALG
jgi:hypothetical protein